VSGDLNLAKPRRILGAAPDVADKVQATAVGIGNSDPHTGRSECGVGCDLNGDDH